MTTAEAKTKQRSYFNEDIINRYTLDDGESFIEHKKLDEGLFQAYQDITSKIKVDRTGEHTEVDMKIGEQRRFLLENLVEGWNLVDEKSQPVKFTTTRLLTLPPHIINGLIDDIYAKNEILAGDTETAEGKK